MSTSLAQIAANRRNAKKSTGPKTQEGKQRVASNALKHGFLAQLVPQEDDDFQQMLHGLNRSLQPADQVQSLLVEQIALAFLRLRRLLRTERDAALLPVLHRQAGFEQDPSDPTAPLFLPAESPVEENSPLAPLWELVRTAAPLGTMEGFLAHQSTRLRVRYEAMLTRQIQRNLQLLRLLKF